MAELTSRVKSIDSYAKFSKPPAHINMQRVLVALMLGAAAAFQRSPVVRARVLAVFNQLHSPGAAPAGATRRSSPALPRELK